MCVDCSKNDAQYFAHILGTTESETTYKKYVEMLIDINNDLVQAFNIAPVSIPPFKGSSEKAMTFEQLKAQRQARYNLKLKLVNRTPRSQKAAGIMALCNVAVANVPKFYLLQDESDVADAFALLREDYPQGKLFARPCPTRPRHGFVDSRPIETVDEAVEMMRQTLEADDQGELILMPAINAAYNAIWRPGLLAFGPGNDGATSGHGSRSIPLVNVSLPDLGDYRNAFNSARIHDGEVGYIESVIERKEDTNGLRKWVNWSRYLTQLRGGPALSTSKPDYIPALTSVSDVVIAEGDLLEWESRAANFAPGTVVYHPGGSLASHYAVHCVLNNVPCLVSSEPKIGDTLEPNSNKEPLDVRSAIRGVAAGSAIEIGTNGTSPLAVKAMLTGLHNVAVFEGQDAFYIGAAASIMIRMGIAASCGEARHAQKSSENHFSMDRDQVYEAAFDDLFESRKLLSVAYDMFINRYWNSGYGGKPWAMCTKAVSDLDDAVRDMVRNPSSVALNNVISKLNIAVNCAHNNGWWMNKFVEGNAMDRAAKGYPDVFIDSVPMLAALHDVPEDVIDTMHSAWLESPRNGVIAIIEDVIKFTSARFKIGEQPSGVKYVHVQYKTKGTKAHASFNLPAVYASFCKNHASHMGEAVPSMAGKSSPKNYYKLHIRNLNNSTVKLLFDDGCVLAIIKTANYDTMQEWMQGKQTIVTNEAYKPLKPAIFKQPVQTQPITDLAPKPAVTPKNLPATIKYGTVIPQGATFDAAKFSAGEGTTLVGHLNGETVTYKWSSLNAEWVAQSITQVVKEDPLLSPTLPKEVGAFDWPKGSKAIKMLDNHANKWLMEINGVQGVYYTEPNTKVWKLQEDK